MFPITLHLIVLYHVISSISPSVFSPKQSAPNLLLHSTYCLLKRSHLSSLTLHSSVFEYLNAATQLGAKIAVYLLKKKKKNSGDLESVNFASPTGDSILVFLFHLFIHFYTHPGL